MPMAYTCDLISGNMRREYLSTGSITLPYVEPIERERDDFMSRDWDARDGLSDEEVRMNAEYDLLHYLDTLDDFDEGEML